MNIFFVFLYIYDFVEEQHDIPDGLLDGQHALLFAFANIVHPAHYGTRNQIGRIACQCDIDAAVLVCDTEAALQVCHVEMRVCLEHYPNAHKCVLPAAMHALHDIAKLPDVCCCEPYP